MRRLGHGLLLLGAVTLGGCGFHLQGGATVPARLQGARIEANGPAAGPLAQALREQLEQDGNTQGRNGPVIELNNVYISQRIVSISPSSGAALEFLNTLHAEVSVRQGKTDILAAEPLLVEHSFTYNSANPLATTIQSNENQRMLVQEGAREVLRRLLFAPALRSGH